MSQKDYTQLIIISCLIRNKELPLTGERSFYSCFKIVSDKQGGYDDSKAPFSARTLRRYVEELYRNKVFLRIEREGIFYYTINQKYFSPEEDVRASDWKKILEIILDNQAYDMYCDILKYFKDFDMALFNKMELAKFENAVYGPVHIIQKDRETIEQINYALSNNYAIKIEYSGKRFSIVPLSYVISRDGTRNYLYYIRKKKLGQPFELSKIKVVEFEKKANVNIEEFLKKIKRIWDIDITSSWNVGIQVIRNKRESREAEIMLKEYFGEPVEETENYAVYKGSILGINDFKIWLRQYTGVCIVLEPEALRNEMIKSLIEKRKRYKENDV